MATHTKVTHLRRQERRPEKQHFPGQGLAEVCPEKGVAKRGLYSIIGERIFRSGGSPRPRRSGSVVKWSEAHPSLRRGRHPGSNLWGPMGSSPGAGKKGKKKEKKKKKRREDQLPSPSPPALTPRILPRHVGRHVGPSNPGGPKSFVICGLLSLLGKSEAAKPTRCRSFCGNREVLGYVLRTPLLFM